jgi:hypothetical protein
MAKGTLLQRRPAVAAALAAALCGCAGPRGAGIEAPEAFDSNGTYSRTYAALEAQTCEAARRTLLSQGYVISLATAEQVRGRKNFQPTPEAHVEVEFNVVCARDGDAARRTIAFVNAVQERYALKKSNSSASVGVGAFGSLSLPFTGSDESLVKVASSTITSAPFYDRFFQLVERYLAGDPGQRLEPAGQALDPPPSALGTSDGAASGTSAGPAPPKAAPAGGAS